MLIDRNVTVHAGLSPSVGKGGLPLGLALMLLLCGCGGSEFPLAPVSGKVTLGGKPVADISVTFQPKAQSGNRDAGPSSYGVTDAEGRFTLKTMKENEPGAVVGTHVVRMSRRSRGPSENEEPVARIDTTLPQKTRDGSMMFDVPDGGSNEANFELGLP